MPLPGRVGTPASSINRFACRLVAHRLMTAGSRPDEGEAVIAAISANARLREKAVAGWIASQPLISAAE